MSEVPLYEDELGAGGSGVPAAAEPLGQKPLVCGRDQKPDTRSQNPEPRNQKPETRYQKPEARNTIGLEFQRETTTPMDPNPGLVSKAHTFLYHSTLGKRVINSKKKKNCKPQTGDYRLPAAQEPP